MKDVKNEIWKEIEGFENYEVSNLGMVRSLKFNKEKILKHGIDDSGYLKVNLYINSNKKSRRIHQLVAVAFLNHTPCGYELVVNHINFDKLNNRVDNLEIVTNRENTNLKHIKSSSRYTGVSWDENANKWRSQIRINGKQKYIGLFTNEIDANNAYQKALSETIKSSLSDKNIAMQF